MSGKDIEASLLLERLLHRKDREAVPKPFPFPPAVTERGETPAEERVHKSLTVSVRDDDILSLRAKYPDGLHFVVGDTQDENDFRRRGQKNVYNGIKLSHPARLCTSSRGDFMII